MENTQKGSMISAIVIAVAVLILTAVAYMQSEKYIKNAALDGCAQYATTQETDKSSGSTVTTPENYWFTKCLEKKGYPKLAE